MFAENSFAENIKRVRFAKNLFANFFAEKAT
jgi:hypothetical protein